MRLTIGTRGSKLALWQAHHIRDRLLAMPDIEAVEIVVIKTTGDRIQDVALAEVGGKGLFTKEIEEALLAKQIDLAVHSMKDVPSVLPDGCALSAVPERADVRDAWVTRDGRSWVEVEVVGTSSLRRSHQLAQFSPAKTVMLRGNVDTRLRKLDEGVDGLDAIILACAGLTRLGLADRITRPIPIDLMLPAVGQGALAIETRAGDESTTEVVQRLDHAATRFATAAERAYLAAIEGSCRVPVAGHALIDGDSIVLRGEVFRDGRRVGEVRGPIGEADAIGRELGERLAR